MSDQNAVRLETNRVNAAIQVAREPRNMSCSSQPITTPHEKQLLASPTTTASEPVKAPSKVQASSVQSQLVVMPAKERLQRKHPLKPSSDNKSQPPPSSLLAKALNLTTVDSKQEPTSVSAIDEQDNDQLFFVPLMQICELNTPLLKRISNRERSGFASTWARLLDDAVMSGQLSNWSEFFMYPKCILWSPARGGKRLSKRQSMADIVKARMALWKSDRKQLWKTVVDRSNKGSLVESPAKKASKKIEEAVIAALRIGDVRKALHMLNSAPFAAKTPATLANLSNRHPQ